MKNDWKKQEQTLYLPKREVYELTVPAMGFLILKGEGSPQSAHFQMPSRPFSAWLTP